MKTLAIVTLLAVAALGTTGCFSLVDWNHNLNHFRVWNEDMNNMHRSADRFFFNYDWDDPSRAVNYETPNT